MVRRIPRKAIHRPLQGGAYVVGRGGRQYGGGLAGSFQAAHDRANRANERRYGQILTGYDDLHKRVMNDLAGVGKQEASDIDRSYRNMSSDVYNSLVNRGFANSTMRHTMQQGVERERMAARGRLNDRLLSQRANYDTGISTGKMGVIERRNDIGPDPALLASMAQQMGASGMGPGGSFRSPIGVDPGMYQNAYQNALAFHMGGIRSGPMYNGGTPLANLMTKMARFRKYGTPKAEVKSNMAPASQMPPGVSPFPASVPPAQVSDVPTRKPLPYPPSRIFPELSPYMQTGTYYKMPPRTSGILEGILPFMPTGSYSPYPRRRKV